MLCYALLQLSCTVAQRSSERDTILPCRMSASLTGCIFFALLCLWRKLRRGAVTVSHQMCCPFVSFLHVAVLQAVHPEVQQQVFDELTAAGLAHAGTIPLAVPPNVDTQFTSPTVQHCQRQVTSMHACSVGHVAGHHAMGMRA